MSRLSLYLIALLAMVASAPVYATAQAVPDASFQQRLEQAKSMYYRGAYAAAEQAFSELARQQASSYGLVSSEIAAYRVMCDISMDRANADWALGVFSGRYPTAPELPMVRYALASRHFDNGRYKEARQLFSLIGKKQLYRDWRTEFEFKRSFCDMRTAHYKEAAAGFSSILEAGQSVYTYPSIFYLGYVKYITKEFAEAISLFGRSSADSRFALMSSYYSLECSFMLKDYQTVADDGPAVYEKVDKELKPKVARILSESFFALKDKDNAARYLNFFRRSGKEFSRKDLYFSGVLFYDMKNYDDALIALRQITSVPDSISQNAWYLMAGCHLGKRNQIAALNAFRAASELDFDAAIKEKAMFSYAKLSFDVNSDISRFDDYMKTYPSNGRADEINNYIAASFLQSKDYASAVIALRKVKNPNAESKENLRNAAFMRALQNMDDGSYKSAMQMLDISAASVNRRNDPLGCLTDYWKAECLFRTERYSEAASTYSLLLSNQMFAEDTPERKMTPYNLAYCHFKTGDYEAAKHRFDEYLDSEDEPAMRQDATVRLADCHFELKEYADAATLYEEAYVTWPGDDDLYPVLQGAVSYTLAGQQDAGIALLAAAARDSRSSSMYPNVLFALGEGYAATGKVQDAKECFLTLRGMKADSVFYAKGLIGLGKINYSEGRFSKSIDCYKTVVADCPSTPEAEEALECLENVYQQMNKPDEFLAYIDGIGLSEMKTGEDREKMLYLSVERFCKARKWSSAATSAQSFLVTYPDGPYSANVKLHLARALAATGRREAALNAYLEAASSGDASLAETATLEYASLAYSMEKYARAEKSYSSLIMMSPHSGTRTAALSGRMKASYMLKKYDNVITDAQSIGTLAGAGAPAKREAQYYLAKAYLKKEGREFAKPLLATLSGDVSDEFGAEACYLLVEDAFNTGNFEDVESRTDAFSNSGTTHLYWLARSFIILGDSYAARGDLAQAESVYRSVKGGYSSNKKDDILGRVDGRLKELQNKKTEVVE